MLSYYIYFPLPSKEYIISYIEIKSKVFRESAISKLIFFSEKFSINCVEYIFARPKFWTSFQVINFIKNFSYVENTRYIENGISRYKLQLKNYSFESKVSVGEMEQVNLDNFKIKRRYSIELKLGLDLGIHFNECFITEEFFSIKSKVNNYIKKTFVDSYVIYYFSSFVGFRSINFKKKCPIIRQIAYTMAMYFVLYNKFLLNIELSNRDLILGLINFEKIEDKILIFSELRELSIFYNILYHKTSNFRIKSKEELLYNNNPLLVRIINNFCRSVRLYIDSYMLVTKQRKLKDLVIKNLKGKLYEVANKIKKISHYAQG